MLFRFKKRKVVLDCFTADAGVIELTPICPAIKHIPSWWRDLPKSYSLQDDPFPHPTMKTCAGMLNLYTEGISIPMWSELGISSSNGAYRWQFSDEKTRAIVHPKEQRGGLFPAPYYEHIKIESPWYFKTKADINWVWTAPVYNFESPENFLVLPAVVNFKRQSTTNINLMIPLTQNKIFTIPVNTPIVNIYPMSEAEIVIKRHLVTYEEVDRIFATTKVSSFINKYRTNQALKMFYSDCPYGKGVK